MWRRPPQCARRHLTRVCVRPRGFDQPPVVQLWDGRRWQPERGADLCPDQHRDFRPPHLGRHVGRHEPFGLQNLPFWLRLPRRLFGRHVHRGRRVRPERGRRAVCSPHLSRRRHRLAADSRTEWHRDWPRDVIRTGQPGFPADSSRADVGAPDVLCKKLR